MKEIKEFDTFNGTDGFIIVDGESKNIPGGKLKIPNYANAAEGSVLTKTSDDIVWQVPQGGSDPLPNDVAWNIKSGSTPNYPEPINADIECYITGYENGKAQLSWIWKLKPNGSGAFEGPTQSGAFDW